MSASRWLWGVGLMICSAASQAAEPLAVFEVRERLGRDWARTVVTYQIETTDRSGPTPDHGGVVRIAQRIKGDEVRLVDAASQAEVPFQFWRVRRDGKGLIESARVSFYASLSANGTYRFELLPGRPALRPETRLPAGAQASAEAGNLKPTVFTEGAFLTLENGLVAIRLPPPGEIKFDPPLSFGSDHAEMLKLYGSQAAQGIAPGPIQGIRLMDGRWVGGSYFSAANPAIAPKLLGYDCRVIEDGPVFTEACIRYRFEGDRFYQLTARVLPGDPAVRIDEQFDMKRIGSTCDWRGLSTNDWQVVMSLTSGWQPGGWQPDSAFWERYSYGSALKSQQIPLEARLKEMGFDFTSRDTGTHHVVYDQPSRYIFGVEPWCPWGTFAAWFGLLSSHEVDQLGNTPFLAVIPMHAGSWRMDGPYNYKQFITHRAGDAALHWPLDVFPHPNRIIHTGEYDPQLPWSFCRRIYALVGGPLQTLRDLHTFRSYEGYINLDQYKDWVLDWPDDQKVTYPRLFFGKAEIERIRPRLDQHPAAALLETSLYFNDDEKRRNELWSRLTGPYGPFGVHNQTEPDLTYYFTLFRQGHYAEEWLAPMDELLSSPSLTAAQRQTLRRKIAAFCHLASEPDFNPRGSMTHLGNPNMPINRFLALPFAAALIPDHPRAADWLGVSEQYVRYKLASNVAPGGGWSELFTYYDASAPALIHAANILDQAGYGSDPVTSLAIQTGIFPLAFLSPPDPRFGVRLIPCWGHEGRESFGQWLPVAGLARAKSRDTAREMAWAWDQVGRLAGFHDRSFTPACTLYADARVEAPSGYVPPDLRSAWVPGIGAVLRAHGGDPNETFLAYRQGYFISHCDHNQGDFILHAKGAPLIDLSLFAYNLHNNEQDITLNQQFGWYSVPRFSTRDNVADVRKPGGDQPGVWNPSSAIHAHSLGESVDYLRGHSDNQGRRWTRQILFLKGESAAGPNYFVFRDSTDRLRGGEADLVPYWWNFRTVGTRDQVAIGADQVNYTSQSGPRLNVRFLQPAAIQAETREATRTGQTLGHVDTWKGDLPVIRPNQANWTKTTETFTVTSVGPIAAGTDALVALYPQGRDEPPPHYERLGDSAARITTSEGTDYIFVNRHSLTFQSDDVAFTGRAGAVRVYPGEVHLVIAEGPGEVRYQGVTLKSDAPATRVIPAAQLAKPQRIEVRPEKPLTVWTLNPRRRVEHVQPGVRRRMHQDGFAYEFGSTETLRFEKDGVLFEGRRGGVLVDHNKKTVRLIMQHGERIGYENAVAWGGEGPYEVTYSEARIVGRSAGRGRFLNLRLPPGVNRMASLIVDGQPYAPGSSENMVVVPLMPGPHQFEVRNLEPPPVWRAWQLW